MAEVQQIGRVRKNSAIEIVCSIVSSSAGPQLDVREFFQPGRESQPTRKGIRLNLPGARKLIAHMQTAVQQAEAMIPPKPEMPDEF